MQEQQLITNSQLIKQKKIKYFTENDFDFDVDKLHPKLLLLLDNLRHFLQKDIHIAKGDHYHSPDSWHYIIPDRNDKIMAINIFPDCCLYEILFLIFRFKFGGVGIYPYAECADVNILKDDPTRGKIHLDIRPWKIFRNVWVVTKDKKSSYINSHEQLVKLLEIILPDGVGHARRSLGNSLGEDQI